jgi:hypothetical protein
MATNVYFSPKVRSEQWLYEDIIIESIKMYGQDVYYIPRTLVRRDDILNDEFSRFDGSYAIEVYIETADGFAGEGDLLSKFGIQIRDQATFIMAKRRWEQLSLVQNNDIIENQMRPKEGDLIYLPLTKSLFEIKFVEHEQPFYQLSNLPVFKIQCELFEYGNEEFETGVEEIDEFQYHNQVKVDLVVGAIGTPINFIKGETIHQDFSDGTRVTGEVEEWTNDRSNPNVGYLSIITETGSDSTAKIFYVSDTYNIVGQLSGASWRIAVRDDTFETLFQDDPGAQNQEFEDLGDDVIDFSEQNPFGEV